MIQKLFEAESPHTKRFPNFFIVGAQKAGTTALHEYIKQHPNIAACSVKELHFFSCEKRYQLGIDFYYSMFPSDVEGKRTFDASPSYLHNPKACQRIFNHKPSAKLIALVREPVERAYSAWNMYRHRYLRNRNWFFDEWISFCGSSGLTVLRRRDDHIFNFVQYAIDEMEFQDNNNSSVTLEAPILSHGHYYDQIQRMLSLFNESQILVLENSELRLSTVKCLQKIEAFLGIPSCDWENMNLAQVFEGEYSAPVDVTAKRLLYNYYAASNEQLFDLLGKRYTWGY